MKEYTSIFHEETIYCEEVADPQKVEMNVSGRVVGTTNINMVRKAIANSQTLSEKNKKEEMKKNNITHTNNKQDEVVPLNNSCIVDLI